MIASQDTHIGIYCMGCGGQNIRADAHAAWSVASQRWELMTVYDARYCDDCDSEVSTSFVQLRDRETDENDWPLPTLSRRELATVLAALRLYQRDLRTYGRARGVAEIASDAGDLAPLSFAEIDVLAERLNMVSK